MKIPFDIKFRPQIESSEYKVETRDGRPVRIICWDRKCGYPICGLVYEKETDREYYVNARENGMKTLDETCKLSEDLFIVAPEEEPKLSEFEKVVGDIIKEAVEKEVGDNAAIWAIGRGHTKKLLAITEKEIAKGHEHDVYIPEVTYYEQLKKQWEDGHENGKSEALKDLPRWKRIRDNGCVDADGDTYTDCLCLLKLGWYQVMTPGTKVGGEIRYLSIRDLEKLPGFNE